MSHILYLCSRVRGGFEEKRRLWRHLAIWGRDIWIDAPIRRLRCPTARKARIEAVRWARHSSDFTRPFEDVVGSLRVNIE